MDNTPANQDAVIEFLENLNSDNQAQNQKIETHCAMVFLVGDKAYKVKKNIKFPFLDFSSLNLRKEAFIKEFELNKRSAPELYLQLLQFVKNDAGGFELREYDRNSATEPPNLIEWVLEMRQFEQDDLLSNLASNNNLEEATIKQLAKEIVEFHANAQPFKNFDEVNFCANLNHVIGENNDDLARAQNLLGKERLDNIIALTKKHFEENEALLISRQQKGYVKHCHGDLHLQNLVLYNNKPTLFDCLEFNDDYARIDVLYDLAFLIMDLTARNLPHYANLILNQYINHDKSFDDYSGLDLMPLFLATRSAIRAKISFSISEQVTDSKSKDFFIAETNKYFSLMEDFLKPHKPEIVAIAGLSGSGKSSVAALLASKIKPIPGAVILRSDVIRKKLLGVALDQKLGADAYKAEVSQQVYEKIAMAASESLEAGFSLIIDAVMAKEEERQSFEEIAKEEGVKFTGFWLDADKETLLERVSARTSKISDADAKVVEMQSGFDLGNISFNKINATLTQDEIIEQIMAAIGG